MIFEIIGKIAVILVVLVVTGLPTIIPIDERMDKGGSMGISGGILVMLWFFLNIAFILWLFTN